MSDLISRKAAIDRLLKLDVSHRVSWKDAVIDEIDALPSVLPDTDKWIPIEWHEITDEERMENGYSKDMDIAFDCEMPCDREEIIVQTKHGYIDKDLCYEDDGLQLDSGRDWIEDIVAWMPLPEPYGGKDDDSN